jgi:hypothetical protein
MSLAIAGGASVGALGENAEDLIEAYFRALGLGPVEVEEAMQIARAEASKMKLNGGMIH